MIFLAKNGREIQIIVSLYLEYECNVYLYLTLTQKREMAGVSRQIVKYFPYVMMTHRDEPCLIAAQVSVHSYLMLIHFFTLKPFLLITQT